jgi:Fic family protein
MTYTDLLIRVDEMQEQIAGYGKLEKSVLDKINYKFRLDWNYHSNSMEGNTLTMEETRTVMINLSIDKKPIRDVNEMQGHDQIVQDIFRIGKSEIRISESQIKKIHKRIIWEDDATKRDQLGNWKNTPNHVINYKGEKYDFVSPPEVVDEMHQLLNWLNSEADKIKRKDKLAFHPSILAFEFQLRFLTIHPFYDGNGRTARLLMNLILISFGYPPVIIRKEDKEIYNRYLTDIQGYGGDATLYYEFMCEKLIRSLQLVQDAIDGKNIEEPDDLEKKVVLLEQELINIGKGNVKNADTVKAVWIHSIEPFYLLYFNKIASFEKLFHSIQFSIHSEPNVSNSNDFLSLRNLMNKESDSLKQLSKIVLYVQLNGLNGLNTNYVQDVSFYFDGTTYTLTSHLTNLKSKSYYEFMNEEERLELVTLLMNQLHDRIKMELDKLK